MRQTSSERPRAGFAELRRGVFLDITVVGLLTAALAVASVRWDLPRLLLTWSGLPGLGLLDDAVLVLGGSHLFMVYFGARRGRDLKYQARQRDNAEEELRRRAREDHLTALLNRAGLGQELDDAVAEAAGGGASVTVALIDLDRFKEVNDSLGHSVGDALLVAVGRRLCAELRDDAVLARFGGDEFVVVLRDCDDEAAAAVAERLLGALRRPFEVDELVLEIDASVGVAGQHAVAAGGSAGEELLRAADIAMYAAKSEHRGVVVFTPELDQHDPERLAVFGELRRGIRDGELRVHYQPKAALSGGRVLGVEALVRWAHPERGLLPPAAFIDLAEATGLIRPLTRVVLEQALTDWGRWHEQGLSLTVSVNVSARCLLDRTFPDEVSELLTRHGVPAGALELEITESAAMQDPALAVEVLGRLQARGVRLAVDDYGTGHASLSYLSRLPVSTLKIDRSFVSTMGVDRTDHAIVRSTIDLAHNLGLRVVAEGVETQETWERLHDLGCDEAQGYWLGRPEPADELPARIAAISRLTGTVAPDRVSARR